MDVQRLIINVRRVPQARVSATLLRSVLLYHVA